MSIQHVHAMMLQLILYDLELPLHYFRDAKHQILDLDLGLDAIAASVKAALAETGKIEGGFPESFARNGAGMQTHSPEIEVTVHYRDVLPDLRRFQGGVVSRRPATDHQ